MLAGTVLIMAVLVVLGSMALPLSRLTWIMALCGSILFATALLLAGLAVVRSREQTVLRRGIGALIAQDATATFLADRNGRILAVNKAGTDRQPNRPCHSMVQAFSDTFANPSNVLSRLQERAAVTGASREDVVTRRGHIRLSINRADLETYLWRIEDMTERSTGHRGADSLTLPMLTAGPSGTILFMNDAFRRLIGGRVRSIDRIFADLPVQNGRLHQVLAADGLLSCLVAEVPGSAGRREIYLLPGDSAVAQTVPAPGWDRIEEMPVPLLKVAFNGTIVAANREARALLPMPVGPSTRLSDLVEGLGRPIIDWIGDVAEGRGPGTAQFLRGTGSHQDTHLRISLNVGGQGDDRHLIAVLNDVTELKSLEAQFAQSQKMQAIGQLAGGVAHDFNNLLTAISGHCDLLLLRHDHGDSDYGDLIQINQNANRAASLVSQLLAFSRKQNLMPELLDLRDTMSDLTHLLNRLVGEKVSLVLTHDPDLAAIKADKRQLEQVVMNLVVNARDAMIDGGQIRVETQNVTLTEPLCRDRATVPAGRYVLVRVSDRGVGIPREQLHKIFEPFFTTKRLGEGTGLGLSTAYGIMKQSGGYIFVDSEVGVGTTFTLYFPACLAAAATFDPTPIQSAAPTVAPTAGPAAALTSAPTATPRLGPAKIDPQALTPATRTAQGVVLLVEDEAPVRAFASRALRLRGYTVLEAASAEAALAQLVDPAVLVDIFVTDVIMPGKDGPTWVREALIDRPNTKVIFVSGYAEDAFSEQKALIPQSVFLPKPFSLTDLVTTVHRQLQ